MRESACSNVQENARVEQFGTVSEFRQARLIILRRPRAAETETGPLVNLYEQLMPREAASTASQPALPRSPMVAGGAHLDILGKTDLANFPFTRRPKMPIWDMGGVEQLETTR